MKNKENKLEKKIYIYVMLAYLVANTKYRVKCVTFETLVWFSYKTAVL